MAKKPVTVTIDESILGKIRHIQSKAIMTTNEHWSFSEIAGILIEKGLEVFKMGEFKKTL